MPVLKRECQLSPDMEGSAKNNRWLTLPSRGLLSGRQEDIITAQGNTNTEYFKSSRARERTLSAEILTIFKSKTKHLYMQCLKSTQCVKTNWLGGRHGGSGSVRSSILLTPKALKAARSMLTWASGLKHNVASSTP